MSNAIARIAKSVGGIALPDNAQYRNRMEIRSESSNRLYIVAQRKSDSAWTCSCPGWIFSRNCKHLKTMALLASITSKALKG